MPVICVGVQRFNVPEWKPAGEWKNRSLGPGIECGYCGRAVRFASTVYRVVSAPTLAYILDEMSTAHLDEHVKQLDPVSGAIRILKDNE